MIAVRNLRDVAGTSDRLQPGLLFRGDAPFGRDGRHLVTPLKLRSIVDLRTPRERVRRPYDPMALAERAVAFPLLEDTRPAGVSLHRGFADFNRWVVAERGRSIASVVSLVARPGALPALVHCTAGKDRTGIVIAVMLAWLGVPDDEIAADYALSAANLSAETEEAIEQQREALGVDARERPELLEARPEWMVGALELLRSAYGTAESYLLAHGADPRDLGRLRRALLTTDAATKAA